MAGGAAAEVTARVRGIAEAILPEAGLELVEVEFRREAAGWVLRLYIDRAEGGVTLDDCQRVSEELGDHLDVADLIDHPYHLEVSSPGLDRPLTREADFVRFAGREARISTREPLDGRKSFRGRLAGLEADRVLLDLPEGPRVAIPRGLIHKARLEPEL
ncbi:MAG: ribosome maturation factor RimP [Candidatus Methylomirabilales bacterium]